MSDSAIYLVPDANDSYGNLYAEYVWLDDKWELLGTQRINLTNMTQAIADAGTSTDGQSISAKVLHDTIIKLIEDNSKVHVNITQSSNQTIKVSQVSPHSLNLTSNQVVLSGANMTQSFIATHCFPYIVKVEPDSNYTAGSPIITGDVLYTNTTSTTQKTIYVPLGGTVNISANPATQISPSAITINCDGGTTEETITGTIEVSPSPATGQVTVIVTNGQGQTELTQTLTLDDSEAEFSISNLSAGTYTVSVTYAGDGSHAPQTETTTFTVTQAKQNSTLTVVVQNITEGEDEIIDVYTSGSGTVTIQVTDSSSYNYTDTQTLNGGRAEFSISNLDTGTYTVTATYSGDSNYNSATETNTFVVVSADPPIEEEPVTLTLKVLPSDYHFTTSNDLPYIILYNDTVRFPSDYYPAYAPNQDIVIPNVPVGETIYIYKSANDENINNYLDSNNLNQVIAYFANGVPITFTNGVAQMTITYDTVLEVKKVPKS